MKKEKTPLIDKIKKLNLRVANSFILLFILCFMITSTTVFLVKFSKDNRYEDSPPAFNPIEIIDGLNLERQFNINDYESYVINSDYFYSVLNYYSGNIKFGDNAVYSININQPPLVEIGDMLKAGDAITESTAVSDDCLVLNIEENSITVRSFSELYVDILMHFSDLNKITAADEFKVFYQGAEKTTAKLHSADYLSTSGQMVPVRLKIDNSPLIFINEVNVSVVRGVKDAEKSYYINADFISKNAHFGVVNKQYELKFIYNGAINTCLITFNRYVYDKVEISKIEFNDMLIVESQILKNNTVLYYKAND